MVGLYQALTGGLRPPDPLTRSLAGAPPHRQSLSRVVFAAGAIDTPRTEPVRYGGCGPVAGRGPWPACGGGGAVVDPAARAQAGRPDAVVLGTAVRLHAPALAGGQAGPRTGRTGARRLPRGSVGFVRPTLLAQRKIVLGARLTCPTNTTSWLSVPEPAATWLPF